MLTVSVLYIGLFMLTELCKSCVLSSITTCSDIYCLIPNVSKYSGDYILSMLCDFNMIFWFLFPLFILQWVKSTKTKPTLFILISILLRAVYCKSSRHLLTFKYSGWITPSPLPHNTGAAAVGYDEQSETIWIVGGHTGIQYEFRNGTFIDYGWQYVPERIYGRAQYYTQIDTILYIIDDAGSSFVAFDVRNGLITYDWNSVSIDNGAEYYYSCLASITVNDGYLVVIGGKSRTNGYLDVVHILNLTTNEWILTAPSLNVRRGDAACIVYNNQYLYVIGGSSSFVFEWGEDLNSIEVLLVDDLSNIQYQQWNFIQNLSRPMRNSRAVINGDEILVIGGYNTNNEIEIDEINVINTKTNEVIIDGYLDVGLDTTSPIIVNNVLYSFGGVNWGNVRNWWKYIDLQTVTNRPTALPTTPTNTPITSPTNSPTTSPTTAPTRTTHTPTPSPTHNPIPSPTGNPTSSPTDNPTPSATLNPTPSPTHNPTPSPTHNPIPSPTHNPTSSPTANPTPSPTLNPTPSPTHNPIPSPTHNPTPSPTNNPTASPTDNPIPSPTHNPIPSPTDNPTPAPTDNPTKSPTNIPTISPTNNPTSGPTNHPTTSPTNNPIISPTNPPTKLPTNIPTTSPTNVPTSVPTINPTDTPSYYPTSTPTTQPSVNPTNPPTPLCLSMFVEIGVTGNKFSKSNFEGLYTLSQTVFFHRPSWNAIQSAITRYIKYNGGAWNINNGDSSLTHITNAYFPPINNISIWLHSHTSGEFSIYLTCADSYSPTSTSTNVPTSNPTDTSLTRDGMTQVGATYSGYTDAYSEDIPDEETKPNILLPVVLCFAVCIVIMIVSGIFYWRQTQYHAMPAHDNDEPGRIM